MKRTLEFAKKVCQNEDALEVVSAIISLAILSPFFWKMIQTLYLGE
jgi:hypothetical protein